MIDHRIDPSCEDANLKDYEKTCQTFSWEKTNHEFSNYHTDRVNIAYEAIDRQAENPLLKNKNCLVCSSSEYLQEISYARMKLLSNRLGNALRKLGVKKGDVVLVQLPHTAEFYIALAACAKIGAIVSPLDTQCSGDKTMYRLMDSRGRIIITTRALSMKIAPDELPDLSYVVLIDEDPSCKNGKQISWDLVMNKAPDHLEIEWVSPRTPFLLIYTAVPSSSDTGMYFAHEAMKGYKMTARWALDLKEDDILWTQAQPEWLLNIVCGAFSPWLCGATSFVSEPVTTLTGIYDRIEKNRITVLYTRPSIYKIIETGGSPAAARYDLKSLRHLASVLEPLSRKLIYSIKGILGLPVFDTWWTAETGMITMANFLCLPLKPGSMGVPCPGVQTAVLGTDGKKLAPFNMGKLAVHKGPPAMVDEQTNPNSDYVKNLFSGSWLLTGDSAYIDQDGFYYHQGRSDGIFVSPSGRTGTVRIENELVSHPAITEAGVIRYRTSDREYRIRAFVVPAQNAPAVKELEKELYARLTKNISREIRPNEISFCRRLPRDPDGGISYRALKAIALNIPVKNKQPHKTRNPGINASKNILNPPEHPARRKD